LGGAWNLELVSATSVLVEAKLSMEALGGKSSDVLAVEAVEKVSKDLLAGGSGGAGGGGLGDLFRGFGGGSISCLGGRCGRSSESARCWETTRFGSFRSRAQSPLVCGLAVL